MSRNMGLPLHECHCCQMVETSLCKGKFYVCSICQGFCSLPYIPENCNVRFGLRLDRPETEDSKA